MAGGRMNDSAAERRKADGTTVSVSPSTSVSSLLLLCFCSLKAIVFFKPKKDAPMQFCVFFILKKKSANRMAQSGLSNFLVFD